MSDPGIDPHVPARPRVPAAAVLTGAAGLVHMAAAVTHVGETLLLGLMFALVGWAQMITAVWASAGRSRAALTVMSVTNVAALVGWVLSRTVGLPLLHPGVEAAGTADVLTAVLEVLALGAALVHARGGRHGHPVRRTLPVGLAAAGVLALGVSGTAVATLGSEDGHGHDEGASAAEGGAHGNEDTEDADGHGAADEPTDEASRQPGTLPAALHRHRQGIYHLHEDIDLHRHDGGIVHVHTASKSETSTSGDETGDTDGSDGHDDGADGHAH